MGPEILQFLTMVAIFVVAGLVWLKTIYRPGRTLERWEGNRVGPEQCQEAPSEPPAAK